MKPQDVSEDAWLLLGRVLAEAWTEHGVHLRNMGYTPTAEGSWGATLYCIKEPLWRLPSGVRTHTSPSMGGDTPHQAVMAVLRDIERVSQEEVEAYITNDVARRRLSNVLREASKLCRKR